MDDFKNVVAFLGFQIFLNLSMIIEIKPKKLKKLYEIIFIIFQVKALQTEFRKHFLPFNLPFKNVKVTNKW